MLRRSALISVLVALMMTMSTLNAHAFTPDPGTRFNNPWAGMAAKERQLVKIRRAIKATPRGHRIKIAAYSNDRRDITDALIAADRRGVSVQVLLNGNWTSGQTIRLKKRLGTKVHKKSFVRICKRSCRGKAGNLHSKFYLFSKSGKARRVVMFGSLNMTGYGARTQWNDLHTQTGRKRLHHFFAEVFRKMKQDKVRSTPFIRKSIGDLDINVYPRYHTTKKNDPMMNNLRRISCKGAKGPAGIGRRTLVLINMYGWNGRRGVYLAKKVAALRRHGCVARAIVSAPGGRVVQILKRNRVQVKSPDFDRNANGKVDVFTHAKYMLVSGKYAHRPGFHVWTGSQNWSDRSLHGDEITVHIPRRRVLADYRRNFNRIWENYARWL